MNYQYIQKVYESTKFQSKNESQNHSKFLHSYRNSAYFLENKVVVIVFFKQYSARTRDY